jgi:hypothetical protein
LGDENMAVYNRSLSFRAGCVRVEYVGDVLAKSWSI